MKILTLFVLCAFMAVALHAAFSGLAGDGQSLILKAPDGHCGKVEMDNLNVLTAVTVECP